MSDDPPGGDADPRPSGRGDPGPPGPEDTGPAATGAPHDGGGSEGDRTDPGGSEGDRTDRGGHDGGESPVRDPDRWSAEDAPGGAPGGRRPRRLLLWGTLATLTVLSLVALAGFYLNATAAIDRWVAPEFRRAVRAAFDLVVLLASGAGIALVVRELSG